MDSKGIIFGVLLVASIALSAESSIVSLNNAVAGRNRRSVTPLCSDLLPCRWNVYEVNNKGQKRVTLHIENNNCVCGPKRKCEIAEDNLSLTAFVLRCIEIEGTTTTTTTESNREQSSDSNREQSND